MLKSRPFYADGFYLHEEVQDISSCILRRNRMVLLWLL